MNKPNFSDDLRSVVEMPQKRKLTYMYYTKEEGADNNQRKYRCDKRHY